MIPVFNVGTDFFVSSHYNPTFEKVLELSVMLKNGVFDTSKQSAIIFKENILLKSVATLGDGQREYMRGIDPLVEYFLENKPETVSLVEPRVSGSKVNGIIAKLGFSALIGLKQ
ncbi:hypothetical protein Gorai_002581 [Gossypium raimondii]|uniref:Uncharacterized protein n=1 Tax=Gossypium raimondii TaxID=29730 RepID=A0A7J8QLF2_GOSRA|nr:hypothetical protein [Gossypium raimondii]